MNIETIINNNYDSIVEAIHNHQIEYMLSPYPYELRMYVDDSGTISFESGVGRATNDIWDYDHYVLCKAGGSFTVWDYIGDVFTLLEYDDALSIIDEIPTTPISKAVVEKYIEENHPEWISNWLEEFHDYYYDDEIDTAKNILDEFLDCVNDIEDDDEDSE